MIEERLGRAGRSRSPLAFGATATLEYEPHVPGDRQHAARGASSPADVAAALVGDDNVVRDLRAERWAPRTSRSCCSQQPGAYARIGQGGAEGGCFLHSTRYDFNDEILPLGAALFASLRRARDAAVAAPRSSRSQGITTKEITDEPEVRSSRSAPRCCACGAAQAATLRVADRGDVAVDGPALRSTRRCSCSFTGKHLRAAGRARQGRWRSMPALATKWTQTSSDGVALRPAPAASTSTTARRSRPTTWCSPSSALRGEGSDMKSYTSSDQGSAQGRRLHGRRSRRPRRSRSCRTCSRSLYIMSKKWCEENKADAPGRPAQGHREHRQLQVQRHRPAIA